MRVNLDWLRDWVELGGTPSASRRDLTTSGLEVDSVEPLTATDSTASSSPRCCASTAIRTRIACPSASSTTARVSIKSSAARPTWRPASKRRSLASARSCRTVRSSAPPSCAACNRTACCARPRSSSSSTTSTACCFSTPTRRKASPLAEHLRLDDTVLEINVTPNRGDCFSVVGIARELAARRNVELARPQSAARRRHDQRNLSHYARCRRELSAIRGPRAARAQHRRADSVVDARAAAARRAPADSTDRRRDELRHDRARPAVARLRSRQARRPHRGAIRACERKPDALGRPRRRRSPKTCS